MTTNSTAPSGRLTDPAASRLDWVDYAKGICIIMVVMMHSVLGVEAAAGHDGFMHAVVEFAKPFRMPDFFLISGLVTPASLARKGRRFAHDRLVRLGIPLAVWVLGIWPALVYVGNRVGGLEVLSDVLCEVGVTDAALVAEGATHDYPEGQI